MNRYFSLYLASKCRLPKLDPIIEEVYVSDHEPGPIYEDSIDSWKDMWHDSYDWGQWTDIEYIEYIEPASPPPVM